VIGAWLLSAWSMRRRWCRYVVHFVLLVVVLLALSIAQHLLTDFYDYRDLTPLIALLVVSLLYVFRAPRLGPALRIVAVSAAVATAAFNWVDVARIDGKTHNSVDYAPLSLQTMETLKAYLERRPPQGLGVSRIEVVLDSFFPLEPFYLHDLERYGMPIQPVDAEAFCVDETGAMQAVSDDCDAFLLVTHAGRCLGEDRWDDTGSPRVRAYVYRSVCDQPAGGTRARVEIALGG
jgi:hypothetical protein